MVKKIMHQPYEVQLILDCGNECFNTLSHQDGTFVSTCNISIISHYPASDTGINWQIRMAAIKQQQYNINQKYPWSLDFLPDVISTTSFVSVRWCKGNHFLLWNRRILKTCLSTLPMTLARYNNAKECFVMKLKQNSANCSIDIIWAMWVTMNDNTTGYTLWRRVWAQF